MPYIGREPEHGNYQLLDALTAPSGVFDGSRTVFNLTTDSVAVYPTSPTTMIISLGGVIQEPNATYTVSGNQITFTTAPATSTTFFGIALGDTLDIGVPTDNSVDSASYVDGSIDRVHLAADIIDGTKIDDGVIESEHYAAASIDNAHLADNAVDTDEIADDAVTYVKMQNLGTADRVLGSVSTGVIGEVQIVPDMIATDAVTTIKIADDAVTTVKILDDNVTTAKILDDNITTAKILDANVTLAKIESQAANTVLVRDASSSGVVSAKAVADTQLLIGDGTGFTAATLSGDATLANSGGVTVTSSHSGSAHHAQAHNLDSHSTRTHGNLQSVGANDHHAQSHTVVSHSDTTATGAELETLTDGSTTALHAHAGGASDTAYASSWNGVTGVAPSKNAVYDKIETMGGGERTTLSGTRGQGGGSCACSFTGAGFAPTHVQFMLARSSNDNYFSTGFGDSDGGEACFFASGSGQFRYSTSKLGRLDHGSYGWDIYLTSFDSDGVTLQFNQLGGGQSIEYLVSCIK